MKKNVTIAALVYNPKSGSALTKDQLAEVFESHNISIGAFIAISDTLHEDLAPYIKKNALIAAIGGDGTLSAVAGVLTGTESIFAPLSGGTLNHFTKDLGIKQDLNEAVEAILDAKPQTIDVASINDTVFINNSSLGLYPSSLQVRGKLEDRLGKWPSAVIGVIRAFVQFRSYHLTINKTSFDTPFIFVGNNDYHLDTLEGSRTSLNEGLLSVYVISSNSRFTLLKLLPYALIGKLNDHDAFHTYHTTSFTISSKRPAISISHDGELSKFETPLTYAIIKDGLRIIGNS